MIPRILEGAMLRCLQLSSIHFSGMLLCVLTTGCAGPLYDWKAHSRSPVNLSLSVLVGECVAVLPAQVAMSHIGYRQVINSALDRTLVKVFPEAKFLSINDVTNGINAQGQVELYGELLSAYASHGILERTRLERLGAALGARYVFLPTLTSHTEEMENRWAFFGVRLVQTRIGVIRMALQLWDTKTGMLMWSSISEATLSSEVIRQSRIRLDHSAEIVWTAMLLDLRDNRKESTYTPLDHLFQTFGPNLTKATDASSGETVPVVRDEKR
jgi:hypothetical protein